MLSAWVEDKHHSVAYSVGVRFTLGIFLFAVLHDAVLLAFLDVIPIRLESNV